MSDILACFSNKKKCLQLRVYTSMTTLTLQFIITNIRETSIKKKYPSEEKCYYLNGHWNQSIVERYIIFLCSILSAIVVKIKKNRMQNVEEHRNIWWTSVLIMDNGRNFLKGHKYGLHVCLDEIDLKSKSVKYEDACLVMIKIRISVKDKFKNKMDDWEG